MDASLAIIFAESLLSLTPIAIKNVSLDPVYAVWSRILTSGALGFFLTDSWGIESRELGSALSLGALNLAHIASSYESFRHLPAGQAMSILYTYPFWNLIFGSIFRHENISVKQYGMMGAATVGSFLLNLDAGSVKKTEKTLLIKSDRVWGISMALLMALTESGIFTISKILGWEDPAKSVWILNGTACFWLSIVSLLGLVRNPTLSSFNNASADWWGLTAFHAFSVFCGYWLRFFAISRLSTITYSILSYSGLLSAYIFGFFFMNEKPGWISIVGASIIILSGISLMFF